jgi:hypothetical protein
MAEMRRVLSEHELAGVADLILEFAIGMKLLDFCKVETMSAATDSRIWCMLNRSASLSRGMRRWSDAFPRVARIRSEILAVSRALAYPFLPTV